MKKQLIGLSVLAAVAAAPAMADTGAMAQMKGCMGCHKVDAKLVGPSYQEVAAKYKGDAGAVEMLAAKVKAGGSGVWGPIPMPPNAHVSDAEATQLVEWILSH